MVLLERFKRHWLQALTHIAALTPLALLVWKYWQGLFLVDPVREITTATGQTALVLLILSLAVTPIYTVFGFKQVRRVRRALGLYAFLYVSVHFLTFVGLDYRFDLDLLGQAIFEQRFVLVGFTSGLLLIPLALTSTKGSQKRLGKHWTQVHRLVFLAVILDLVHFAWLVKDIREPLRYAALLALLLVLRIPRVRRSVSQLRRRLASRIRARERV
jgi:sulfoxide reductase heme-binding subunit YedZ